MEHMPILGLSTIYIIHEVPYKVSRSMHGVVKEALALSTFFIGLFTRFWLADGLIKPARKVVKAVSAGFRAERGYERWKLCKLQNRNPFIKVLFYAVLKTDMYSRTGIAVYRKGVAISRAWRPSEFVSRSTRATTAACQPRCASSSSTTLDSVFPRHEKFARRHIGPNEQEQTSMLEYLGLEVRLRVIFLCVW